MMERDDVCMYARDDLMNQRGEVFGNDQADFIDKEL